MCVTRDTESRKERAAIYIPAERTANARDIIHGVTLTSFRFEFVEGGSVACGGRITRDRARPTLRSRRGIRRPGTSAFLPFPLPALLARASAIGNSRFYVSLFVAALPRAESNSNRCPRGHSQKLQGMREGGNGASRATGRFERARENSSSLFMSFLFDLLSSRSRPPFSLLLSLPLPRPLDEREYEFRRRERDGGNGKKGGKYAWRHSFAREGAGNLSFTRGRKKSDIFPRSCWRVARLPIFRIKRQSDKVAIYP